MRCLHDYDVRISRRLRLKKRTRPYRWAQVGAHVGDGLIWLAATGAVLLVGIGLQREELWQSALQMLAAILATALLVAGLKFAIRRERPGPAEGFTFWRHDRYSFPSGHAARMTAIAVTIFGSAPLTGVLFGIVALMVGLSRIALDLHYPSDVLAGWLIGAVAAWVTLALWPAGGAMIPAGLL